MATDFATQLPGLGQLTSRSGVRRLRQSSDGYHQTGTEGVTDIVATGDGKVEFIAFADRTLAYVKSAMGHPAYYPVRPVRIDSPVKAVLMDLDGTTVRSEDFWVWIIKNTIASLLDNPHFTLEDADLPYVSGHSVSEHLQYCIDKYCPDTTVEQARTSYFKHTHHEMNEIMLRHLVELGAQRILVANRSPKRARQLAENRRSSRDAPSGPPAGPRLLLRPVPLPGLLDRPGQHPAARLGV